MDTNEGANDIELDDLDPGLCQLFYKMQEFFGCSPEHVMLVYDKGHGDEEGAFSFLKVHLMIFVNFQKLKGL